MIFDVTGMVREEERCPELTSTQHYAFFWNWPCSEVLFLICLRLFFCYCSSGIKGNRKLTIGKKFLCNSSTIIAQRKCPHLNLFFLELHHLEQVLH